MKESELIIMRKKIEQLGGLMQGVLQELNNLRDLSVGTLETVKRLPGYKKAITKEIIELLESKFNAYFQKQANLYSK